MQPTPHLLLLHGSAETPACWDALIAQLDPSMDVTRSSELTSLDAIHDYGGGMTSETHVVGHSYGGVLALELALFFGPKIASLTLIEPVVFGILVGRDEDALGPVVETGRAFDSFEPGNQRPALKALLDYWFGTGAWERAPQALRDLMFQDAVLIRDQIQHAAAYRPSDEDLAHLIPPTLLLSASRSTAAAQSICRILSTKIPGARRAIIEGARHDLIRTHAPAIAAALGLPTAG